MKKFKVNFAILALLIGSTAAFAFKPAEHKTTNAKSATTWYFNGGTGDVQNAADYSKTSMPTDCAATGTLPCSISVDASNKPDLQTFLNSETVSQIVALSAQKRP